MEGDPVKAGASARGRIGRGRIQAAEAMQGVEHGGRSLHNPLTLRLRDVARHVQIEGIQTMRQVAAPV